MKRNIFVIALAIALLVCAVPASLTSFAANDTETEIIYTNCPHSDADGNGICDICKGICVDFYEVPGDVTSLVGENALHGSVPTLYIPATVLSIEGAFDDLSASNLVLKTTSITENEASDVASMAEKSPVTVYCHTRTDEKDNVASLLDGKTNVTVKNILSSIAAIKTEKVEGKNKVTSVGCIAVPDLAYGNFKLVVTFKQNGEEIRTKEQTFTSVATTVTGYASTDLDTATARSIAYVEDGTYLVALTVSGVPAGDYTVETQVVASVKDAEGNAVEVCSSIASNDITVSDV